MEITFLGTSCMVPTKDRNAQAIFLSYKNEGILIDCGEGTQRQMNIAGIKRTSITKILITHWHGDHVAGLVGLIQTLGNIENPPTIHLYGPKGTKEHMGHLMKCCKFDARANITIHELNPKDIHTFYEDNDFKLECATLRHSVPCLGYSFIDKDKRRINMAKAAKLGLKSGPLIGKLQDNQTVIFKGTTIKPSQVAYIVKGKKVTFILDTVFCTNAVKLAQDADLLIIETVYASDLEEKAEQYKHMTTQQAAFIATKANVKELICTHFSQRYKTAQPIENDIRKFFLKARAAFDFMKVKV
ncbi:MAG: ribonuclease Z [archaeon]